MKSLKFISVMFTISFILSACASQGSGGLIDVECDDFYENAHISDSLDIRVGDGFTVNLCSNATTGFQWGEMPALSNASVLQLVSHEFISPNDNGDSASLGSPGSQMWTFKTREEGLSTLSFDYSRNWEGGEKGEWTFVLTVNVK